jgi:hypothetical protein
MMWVTSFVAVAIWLVLLAVLERAWRRTRHARDAGTPMSQASFDEFVSFLYGTKRVELEQRATHSLMREEDYSGAPPLRVDLDKRVVVLDPPHTRKSIVD